MWSQGDEHIQLQLALLSMYSVPQDKGKVGEHKEHYIGSLELFVHLYKLCNMHAYM